MITVTTPVEFIPWPDDMPDGYIYVGTPLSAGLVQESIDNWRLIPSAYSTAFNVPLPTRPSSGRSGKPKVVAGVQSNLDAVNDFITKSPLGGLYSGQSKPIYVLRGEYLPHEWGHMLDFEYSVRTGGADITLRAKDTALASLIGAVQPFIQDGLYAKTNTTEWFAVLFDGWVRRDRRIQALNSEPSNPAGGFDEFGAGVMAVRAKFAELFPFDGMDDWRPYNSYTYPQTSRINRGEECQIHIDARGNPMPTSIRWEKSVNGATLVTDPSITDSTFNVTFPVDTGVTQLTYIAYATNTLGESQLAVFNFLPGIANQRPTIYLGTPAAVTGASGSIVTLVSAASGSPEPSIRWDKFDVATNAYVDTSDRTRVINVVVPPSGSIDIYRAVFINTFGNTYGSPCEVREPTTTLAPVIGLLARVNTEASISFQWTKKSGAASYRIEYKQSSASVWIVYNANYTTTSATITGLLSSTSYDIRIYGVNAVGLGEVSSTLTALTTAPASGTRAVDVTGVSAAAAYGMRKLRSTYNGPAIRLIRYSDYTERDIPFSGDEIDTAAYEAFVTENVTEGEVPYVVTWYDQSANAVHLSQTNILSRPNVIYDNGRLVIRFNTSYEFGNVGFLTRASFGIYTAAAATVSTVLQPFEDFGAYTNASVITETTNGATVANSYHMVNLVNGDATWQVRGIAASIMWTSSSGSLAYGKHVATYTDNGSQINTWIDGTQNRTNFTATRSGSVTPIAFNIGAIGIANTYGAQNFYKGTISEVIVWKSVLTSTQRQALELDQKTYYGVA